tara:strand:- start:6798 stop:7181 length:384 start_codon:yes stop_codon:yes gene_type:complete
MNNISYIIEEPLLKKNDLSNSLNNIPPIQVSCDNSCYLDEKNTMYNELLAYELDYDLNYTIKYLTQILEFYGFKKCKKSKKEIIRKIINFEMLEENSEIVYMRKRMFDNFIELKNNSFFSKYIISNL